MSVLVLAEHNNIEIIEKLNTRLTLFELLTLVYIISASKLKNASWNMFI